MAGLMAPQVTEVPKSQRSSCLSTRILDVLLGFSVCCDVIAGDPNTGPPVPKASTLPSLPLLQHHFLCNSVSHIDILISRTKSQSGHRMLSNLEGVLLQVLQLLWEFVGLWANTGKIHGSDRAIVSGTKCRHRAKQFIAEGGKELLISSKENSI